MENAVIDMGLRIAIDFSEVEKVSCSTLSASVRQIIKHFFELLDGCLKS